MKSVFIVASLPILVLAGEISREKRQTGIQLPQFDASFLPTLLTTFVASLTVNAGRTVLENLGNDPLFANCGDGSICSPNYPEPYPEDLDITWTLTAPEGRKIKIFLAELELYADEDNSYDEDYPMFGTEDYPNPECDGGDYVELNDLDTEGGFLGIEGGRSANSILGSKILKMTTDSTSFSMCGYLDVPTSFFLVSSENEMTIKFTTTSGVKTAKGFRFFVTDDTGANSITTSYVLN